MSDKTEDAKALLKKGQDERIEKCKEDMDKIMTKHKCTFQVSMTILPDRNIPRITIVPL